MEAFTFTDIQEKLKDLKSPEDQKGFLKELLGPSYELFVQNMESMPLTSKQADVKEKIQALKRKGMTTGGIRAYLKEAEGVELSREKISAASEEDIPRMHEWLTRPLSHTYPIVFLDGMHCSVKENGKTVTKCSYHALGINMDGEKELLGIWIADTEGAKFWGNVLLDLKNRGVEDILICCIDGLKGFSKAITDTFPKTTIQQCINHLVRGSSKYVTGKNKEKFCADLKEVYNSPTEEAGLVALEEMKKKWPDFEPFLRRWEKEWSELASFFSYPEPVRRLVYTTNPIESLHSEFRRVTKGISPNEEGLRFRLWDASRDITKKWSNKPISDWGTIIAHLSRIFDDRDLLG